jgi:hypothetical protein
MNAYELADYVNAREINNSHLKNAATMLRQQADRIAELEKDLEGCEYFLKSNPHKELSDEEIEKIMYKCDWSYDPVSFARAIIKASRGEE